jgi:hypothetical protein
MTMRRMMVMAGGAVVPIALISILVGNQWVTDAINDDGGLHRGEGITPLVSWLLFPSWRLTGEHLAGKYIIAKDFSTVLFFVLLILLAVAGARAVDPNRGALGALVTGWWATTVAGGIAGFVGGVLTNWALDLPSGAGPNVLLSITPGVAFGFAYGWLAGIGMLLGYVITRRGAAQQPGQYAPQQPGMPMQQPYGQPVAQQPMQQQPVQQQYAQPQYQQQQPYVPPQGQPQQPVWGGAPPQQQYGAPPAPQQQPPPAQQQPPVPQQAAPPAPEQTPPSSSPAAPEASPEKEKAPDDDDLGLADRTIIDRKPDGEDT